MKNQKRWVIKADGYIYHEFVGTRYKAVKLFDRFCMYLRASHNQAKCTLEGWDI